MADEPNLLPDDSPPIDADTALADAVANPLDPTADPETYPPEPEPLGRSWDFDPYTGQFTRYASRAAETHDLETLKVWIVVTLLTARFAHEIFSDDYGVEEPLAMINDREAIGWGAYQKNAERALKQHEWIEEVGDWRLIEDDAQEEYVRVGFTVELISTQTLNLEVPLVVG